MDLCAAVVPKHGEVLVPSLSHPGHVGSCCLRLSQPVQPRRTRQVKHPFAILAACPVACFCLGRSLPLPALLGGDFTSSDARTSRDSRDWMLQPGAPGPSQHPIPFLRLHLGSQEAQRKLESSRQQKPNLLGLKKGLGGQCESAQRGWCEPSWRSVGWCPTQVADERFRQQWSRFCFFL